MANGNIYGQVPRALRETRLTLRDIMTDMAKTTAEDAKLRLALDAQRGQVEIEKMQGEADLAKISAERELEMGKLAETERHHKAMEAIYRKPEDEILRQSDSMRNWILKYPGISSAMKDIAMKNLPAAELDQTMTGAEAKMLFESINKNPGFFYRNLQGVVIDRMEGLMTQMQDPNVTDEHRETLFAQYEPLLKQLDRLETVIGVDEKITAKDMEGIQEMAIEFVKAGDGTVSEEEAVQMALDSVTKIRKAVHGTGKRFFPKTLKELMEGKPAKEIDEGVDDKADFRKYKPEERKPVETTAPDLSELAQQPPVEFGF